MITSLRSIDSKAIEKVKTSFINKTNVFVDEIELSHEPFTHCIIKNLLHVDGTSFFNDLREEINKKLKFMLKNNDLYKFKQVKINFNLRVLI